MPNNKKDDIEEQKSLCLNKDIILGEITGKNAAIHAYDKIIWMIRSGYFTLLYGGWAILLNGIIDKEAKVEDYQHLVVLMLAITLGLVIGAYVVDRNYMQRKFRVIFSLNKLMDLTFGNANVENINDKEIKDFKKYLKVSQ